MNKTRIEWTDFTWNPVTGCWGPGGTAEKPNRCSYCAARTASRRFWRKYVPDKTMDPFVPMLHTKRLSEPAKVKKPSKIFVCFMADLFGDWVPQQWIIETLAIARYCSHHTFQFLTKNPKRLKDFKFSPNCWVGTTVTNQEDEWRLRELLKVKARVRFVSHEPLISAIDLSRTWFKVVFTHSDVTPNWAIIGGMTGPGAVKPEPEWVQGLIDQYQAAGVPVFVKGAPYKDFPIREWPG